jgi:hypothetical protein
MTARISLILGKTRGHRPRLQTRPKEGNASKLGLTPGRFAETLTGCGSPVFVTLQTDPTVYRVGCGIYLYANKWPAGISEFP